MNLHQKRFDPKLNYNKADLVHYAHNIYRLPITGKESREELSQLLTNHIEDEAAKAKIKPLPFIDEKQDMIDEMDDLMRKVLELEKDTNTGQKKRLNDWLKTQPLLVGRVTGRSTADRFASAKSQITQSTAKLQSDIDKIKQGNLEEKKTSGEGLKQQQSTFLKPLDQRRTWKDWANIGHECCINVKKLKDSNLLSVMNQRIGRNYNDYKNHIVSKPMKRILLDIVDKKEMNKEDIADLTEDEIKLLDYVLMRARRNPVMHPNKKTIPTAVTLGSSSARHKARLKIILGEQAAGNNNPALQEEKTDLAKRLLKKKSISPDLFMELLA
jgi:hypothetical protein